MSNTPAANEMSPQELAEACAQELFQRDTATNYLKMRMFDVAPGQASIEMEVQPHMVQGHQTCHGGYLFTLADSAFAMACNTYNQPAVAIGCSIEYVKPGRLGDLLTANAKERSRSRSGGNYDVDIRNQAGELIALFRGKSYNLRGTVLPEEFSND